MVAEGMVAVGAGAMGAAGVDELPLELYVVLELLNGRFCDCQLKETCKLVHFLVSIPKGGFLDTPKTS